MGLGERRKWGPDVKMIADQLIEDYRTAPWAMETGQMGDSQGDNDSLGTLASWLATAKDHGEEFQEDDWIALVRELARRAAAGCGGPRWGRIGSAPPQSPPKTLLCA